jgi:HSP20 family protein
MTLVKWSPITPQLFSQWPSFFEDEDWSMDSHQGLSVYETDNNVIVEANVAGVPEDNIDVSVEGGTVTIKAEYQETDETKKRKKVVYKQARESKYIYTTSVPCPIKAEQAQAEVENGVLTLTLPKKSEAKPKKITVKAKGK